MMTWLGNYSRILPDYEIWESSIQSDLCRIVLYSPSSSGVQPLYYIPCQLPQTPRPWRVPMVPAYNMAAMEAEPLPSYYNAAVSIYTSVTKFRKPSDPYIGFGWLHEAVEYSRFTKTDYLIVIFGAVFWTVSRYLLSKWVFVVGDGFFRQFLCIYLHVLVLWYTAYLSVSHTLQIAFVPLLCQIFCNRDLRAFLVNWHRRVPSHMSAACRMLPSPIHNRFRDTCLAVHCKLICFLSMRFDNCWL